jgi:hypothetical protein
VTFGDVLTAFRRRWYVIVAAVLIAALVAGVYQLTRPSAATGPTRFASTTGMTIASNAENAQFPAPDNISPLLLTGQSILAMSPAVTRAAYKQAGYPTTTPVQFRAQVSEAGDVKLIVTARAPTVAEKMSTAWGTTYADARQQITKQDLQRSQRILTTAVQAERKAYNQLTKELDFLTGGKPPVVSFNPSSPSAAGAANTGTGGVQTPLLADQPLPVAQKAYAREAVANSLVLNQIAYGEVSSDLKTPKSYARLVGQTSPRRIVPRTSSSKSLQAPGLVLLLGLLLGCAAAIVYDRVDHTIRTPREAAMVFSAPVLAMLPFGRRREVVAVTEPGSELTEAYKTLAATAVATERLPSALMVTSPRGHACDDVAVNLAVALASIGVRVALIATSPSQSWYNDQFQPPPVGTPTFPELLDLAHRGLLNGEVERLIEHQMLPNLVLLPPGAHEEGDLPLDGLRPLLEGFSRGGIELSIIAGPALLDKADATIVAWTTRTVLWALAAGEARHREAAEAAARLELTGVSAFGVTVLGAES